MTLSRLQSRGPRHVAFAAMLLMIAVMAIAVALPSAAPQGASAPSSPTPVTPPGAQTPKSPDRELLDRYCVGCHNPRTLAGGLTLDDRDPANVASQPDVWERVVYKVRAGMMPPVSARKPEPPVLDAFTSRLVAALDANAKANPDPGRTESVHRMNRPEFQNAIRDLLALDLDMSAMLPADDTHANGFSNMAETLTISPSLLDRYISTARQVSRLAVGIVPALPEMFTYRTNVLLDQREWLGEEFPLGSRGGIAVRRYFPVDGEYTAKIRLQRNYVDYIRGMGDSHTVEIRLDGALVKQFSVGGEGFGGYGRFPGPASHGGDIHGDSDWTTYMFTADDGLKTDFAAKAGSHVVTVAFLQKRVDPEGVKPARLRPVGAPVTYDEMPDGAPAVDQFEIGGPTKVIGPGDTPSRRRIFVCRPRNEADEERCATTILSNLARRAFRREIQPADMAGLLTFFKAEQKNGFDKGIEFALERILSDPEFVFRIERDPANVAPGASYRISDLELASRLSFFLWSSIPDDELLDLAIHGKLRSPGVLQRQVQRLLADKRSDALIRNFAGEWLETRNVEHATPDETLFPAFDENLRRGFQMETELFLKSQFREDRSLVDLLTANYTFLNERLAKHYGIPNVSGDRFRRVTITDPQRMGILGQGSILLLTSYPNRTSPVLRGKYLLSNVLGTPPSPPPEAVPGLPDRGVDGKPTTVRARLEEHRKNPVCAACHQSMDPLGFALENFDAVGAWRTSDGGAEIDPSGKLPTGGAFAGPSGLRALLVEHGQQFAATATEKLLTYALGRALGPSDPPVIRGVTRAAASSDYRWSAVILGIVESTPFQMRKSRPSPSPIAAVSAVH